MPKASKLSVKRSPKAAPESIQIEKDHLLPILQRLFIVCTTRNHSFRGPIQIGYLESWENKKLPHFYMMLSENYYCEIVQ